MRRRDFITLVGGAVTAWPLAARAQQTAMPVIGYLRSSSFDAAPHQIAGFRQGLKESGFIEGQNVTIEFRSAEGNLDRLSELLAELIRHPVAVIVANGNASKAAKDASKTIPIVFAFGGDPIRDGLVTSISRPEGNLTGVTFLTATIGAKRLELLRELVPRVEVVAVLHDPANPAAVNELKDLEAAARTLGCELVVARPTSEGEIDTAFAMFMQRRAGALFAGAGPFLLSHRAKIVALAERHALAALYPQREYTEIGGLMSYGSSQSDAYRQAGLYVGRILKGAKPADLPVVQPTKFEHVINLKTAKTLGLAISQSLQVAADEVIE
jgi:putative ABC transport system substrate-binding protein